MRGRHFHRRGEIAMTGEDFSLGGRIINSPPGGYLPGRIITGKYPPGETFLGGELPTGHRINALLTSGGTNVTSLP